MWLEGIEAIENIEGVGREIHLSFKCKTLSDDTLRDLIAIMYRYKIDMRCLAKFLNKSNESWLRDKKMYWYEQIFGA